MHVCIVIGKPTKARRPKLHRSPATPLSRSAPRSDAHPAIPPRCRQPLPRPPIHTPHTPPPPTHLWGQHVLVLYAQHLPNL